MLHGTPEETNFALVHHQDIAYKLLTTNNLASGSAVMSNLDIKPVLSVYDTILVLDVFALLFLLTEQYR